MIGLFDSGIGGLTVAREIIKRLPNNFLLYLGDTARTPYGNKSAEVIKSYGLEAAKFLIERGAKIIVVACNTVSAVGLEEIRQAYPSIPLFDVISPAVSAIIENQKSPLCRQAGKIKNQKLGCIGIMGTRALINSGVYQKLLSQHGYEVVEQAAPLLVPLVEEGWLDKPETKRVIKKYLSPFKQAQVDTLVLACTHYPLLKSLIIPRVGKRVKVIDPAAETAMALVQWLAQNPKEAAALDKGTSHYFVTDLTTNTEKIASSWLNRPVKLEKIELK